MRDHRPAGLGIAEGCRLMGIARSTYYDRSTAGLDDTALVEAIAGIYDAFEAYGWRRVRAALRQQGIVGNQKWIRRLMRVRGLQPAGGSYGRPTATTISRSSATGGRRWPSMVPTG